jgi:hypothetical protein
VLSFRAQGSGSRSTFVDELTLPKSRITLGAKDFLECRFENSYFCTGLEEDVKLCAMDGHNNNEDNT